MPDARGAAGGRWLVLLHQVPTAPSSARVRIWRRLQSIGAVSLRGSAHVLPDSPERREDFEWIKTEIRDLRGQATVLAADAIDAYTDEEIVMTFRRAREQDYDRLRQDVRRALKSTPAGRTPAGAGRVALARTARRLEEEYRGLAAITFFETPGQAEARQLLAELETRLAGSGPPRGAGGTERLAAADFRRKVWVTRPRPGIDRMASAWLIRRYLDPRARFRFADQATRPGEVAFDMYGAEFSHHEDQCTFEVLARRFDLGDPAVAWIGRIVHDLDLKEDRYGLPEAAGVGRLVEGLRQRYSDDHELLEQGIAMIDSLARGHVEPQSAPARGAARRPSSSRARQAAAPRRRPKKS